MTRSQVSRPLHRALALTALMGLIAGAAGDPPDKTVRVFIIFPNDVPVDSAYPRGIGKIMVSSQKYFLSQCKYTFRLNDPICEVVKGSHPTSWYVKPDDYWTIVNQGTDDLYSQYPAINADGKRSRWKLVIYVNAESPKDGGGGGGGWVGLPKHDADGAKGYPKDTARWCGGMCHELGHCFGLPDATHDDGTVMSADFYHWPVNCVFNANHISTMKNLAANSGFWTDNITGTIEDFSTTTRTPEQWTPLIWGNRLQVSLFMGNFFSTAIALYDLSGKRAALYAPGGAVSDGTLYTFDASALSAGGYVCSLEKNGKIVQRSIVRKNR